jgi:tetratricopeptide (TPR) repeat protein
MKNNDRYWDCLDQAMEASHGGRTDEALAWLDEALRAHPDGAEAHNGRGEILWDDGRVEEALYEFETSLKADPKFITAHLNRAELLVEDMGEYEQAVALCDELLAGHTELRASIAAARARSTTSRRRRSSISTISRARCS